MFQKVDKIVTKITETLIGNHYKEGRGCVGAGWAEGMAGGVSVEFYVCDVNVNKEKPKTNE